MTRCVPSKVRVRTLVPLLASTLALVACDLPPQILLPDHVTIVGNATVASVDNPPLVGLQRLNNHLFNQLCAGGDCGEAFVSVTFPDASPTDPLDLVNPDRVEEQNKSRQKTSGALHYRMESYVETAEPFDVTNMPFFNHGMLKLPFPLFVAEGATTTSYVAVRTYDALPWTHFLVGADNSSCTNVTGPCEQFRDKTFPMLTGNLMLPPAPIFATISLVQAHKVELPDRELVVEDFTQAPLMSLSLSPDVPLVLVHVHVFVNNSGTNEFRFPFGVPDTGDGRDLAVSRIQNLFDWRQVRIISAESTADGYEDVTELRAGIQRTADNRDPREINPDGAFARCGVALRLASVNFIRQSDHFEEDVGRFYISTTSEQWQESINPVVRYIRQLASEQDVRNPNGCGSQVCQRAPPGIHVFVTGTDAQQGGVLALTDTLWGGVPVIVMDGVSQHYLGGTANTLTHELAHALGIGSSTQSECKADRFASTYLPQSMRYPCPDLPETGAGLSTFPDPAIPGDAETCTSIKNSALNKAAAVPPGYEFWPVELYPLLP